MGAVTMSDVARAAGVSPMTVSNVVNGRAGVSDSVRRRVMETIEETGYRINVAARNLRAGRSGVIGLAVPELDNPYFGELARRIVAVAGEHDLRVAVEETGAAPEGERGAIRSSKRLDYDGLILSTVGLDMAELTTLPQLPLMLLGERENRSAVGHIALPNADGAQAAAAHLIDRGARRLAFVGGPDDREPTIRSMRWDGVQAAVRAAGIGEEDLRLVDCEMLTMDAGRAVGRRLGEQRVAGGPDGVDGIFALTDTLAVGLIRGLVDAGLRVPEDVLVAGFDGIGVGAHLTPSLTTVEPDHDWTARRAVERLLERIAMSGPPGEDEIAPFRLVVRESTGG